MAGNAGQPDWMRKLVAELKRDKKKTAILSTLVVVGLIVGLRLAMKSSPARSKAAVATTAQPQSQTPAAPAVASAADDIDREARRQKYVEELDRRITRNLFLVNLNLLAMQDAGILKVAPAPETATQPDPAELEREAIRAEAASMTLQSIMIGLSSTAIINNRVLRVKDRIDGFELLAISPESVLVGKKDVRITLSLKKE